MTIPQFYGPNTALGSREIQYYLGAPFHVHGVNEMLVVTTGPATKSAYEMARSSRFTVHLLAGEDTARWRLGKRRFVPGRGFIAP